MTDLEIAAYVDRGLSQQDRERVENHIAFCDECRGAMVAAGTLTGRSRRRPLVFRRGMLAAAAAAAALILAVGVTLTRDRAGETRLRDGGADEALTVHGPLGEARPGNPVLRFVWGPAASALSYRLTVSRSDGAALWTHDGRDTSVALPDSVRMRAGERYFWTVDAILSNGGSRSSGLREFTLSP